LNIPWDATLGLSIVVNRTAIGGFPRFWTFSGVVPQGFFIAFCFVCPLQRLSPLRG
jgi:hypothetical protein